MGNVSFLKMLAYTYINIEELSSVLAKILQYDQLHDIFICIIKFSLYHGLVVWLHRRYIKAIN